MQTLILNRYRPIAQAGQGGFGTVIVAWDTRMQRKVAIKCIELREISLGSSIPGSSEVFNLNTDDKSSLETFNLNAASKDSFVNNNNNNNADNNNDKIPQSETQVINQSENKKTPKHSTKKHVDHAGEHWQENIPGLKEARTAAMIQDANIVTVYDFEVQNNMAYIIMEYVEGRTLTQFLDEYSNEMSLDMVTCIISGISHAIQVAHNENVLHLDIKPDNVLIDNKGKVKVADFGLATLEDEFGFGTADAGTIGYMPPEQMRQQNLDVRADQWALASIVYEMLCGNNPFEASTIRESLNKVIDADLIVPSTCWEDLDERVNDVVFKALSPEKENRYYSVEEFWDELSGYLGNPRAGQRQLSSLFKLDNSEADFEEPTHEQKDLIEALTGRTGMLILGRTVSVVSGLILGAVACWNISFFGGHGMYGFEPNVWAFVALGVIAAGAVFIPAIGVGLGVILLSVALIMYQNVFLGVGLIAVTVAWFILCGRKSAANSNTLSCFPIGGTLGFAQIAPFMCGLFNKPLYALINTTYGFIICFVLAAFGSGSLAGWDPTKYALWGNLVSNSGAIQENFVSTLSNLSFWIWGASWIVSAVCISFLFESNYRVLRVLGCIAGAVIVISGICFAHWLGSGMVSWQPYGWEILSVCVAGVFSAVIAALLPQREVVQN